MTEDTLPLLRWAGKQEDYEGAVCWLFWSRKAKAYHTRQTLVDVGDFERFRGLYLRVHHSARGDHWRVRQKHVSPYPQLARLIMDAPKGMVVDHVNRDTLDDRRKNLRICTISQNIANSSTRTDGTSRYRGVHMTKKGKWRAQIKVFYKLHRLGDFDSEVEAARAYNAAARKHFTEYAGLNPV